MKKNLVVIHLESVSNCLLNTYQDELPSLREIMAKSTRFKNYFTSATSSVMAVCDFFHGNSFEMDHFTSFDDLDNKIAGKQKNLFVILREAGYQVRAIGYPPPWRDDLKNFHIWTHSLEPFKWCQNEEDFFKTISSDLRKDGDHPFALYIYDIRSHFC